jgi:hypothetical protein
MVISKPIFNITCSGSYSNGSYESLFFGYSMKINIYLMAEKPQPQLQTQQLERRYFSSCQEYMGC